MLSYLLLAMCYLWVPFLNTKSEKKVTNTKRKKKEKTPETYYPTAPFIVGVLWHTTELTKEAGKPWPFLHCVQPLLLC